MRILLIGIISLLTLLMITSMPIVDGYGGGGGGGKKPDERVCGDRLCTEADRDKEREQILQQISTATEPSEEKEKGLLPYVFAKKQIPEWVRNIFIWYGQEQISEDDVLNAITFLVANQIIQIDVANQSMGMMSQEMMMQNMPFNVDAPVIMPMIDGYYKGNKVNFVHTEVSDSGMAKMMTSMINFPTLHVPELKNIPEDQTAKVYVFTNGIPGSEPYGGGPFMFQIDVFDSIPGQGEYSQFRVPHLVTWNENAKPRVLTSESNILKAEASGELTIQKSDTVVNAPMVTWEIQGGYGAAMAKTSIVPRIFESMQVEGELIFVDVNNHIAIFKLHSEKGTGIEP